MSESQVGRLILLCQVAVQNLDTDQHHSRLCVKAEVLELK
jgi:hypothetical protein